MLKYKNKYYFTGGNVQPAYQSSGEVLGESSSLLTNAATGNIPGAVANAAQMTTGSMGRMKDIIGSDLSTGKKLLAGAGFLAGPIGGAITTNIVGKPLGQRREDQAEFNSDIQQRNQMYGLANGGSLLELDGFKHNDPNINNVNGGMLIKQGENGNHVVEGGETLKEGYVYSDTLKVIDGKYKGKTFAEASKKINKIAEERPNDKIVNRTKESQLDALMQQNEISKGDFKAQEEMKLKCGGKIYFKGGKIQEGDFDVDDLSIDEIDYLDSLGYDVEIK